MTKDEALNLALEALGEIEWSNNSQWQSDRAKVAITAIKEALAQPDHIRDATKMMAPPEQEPVARVIDNGTPEGATEWIPFTNRVEPLNTGDLLYATPPQPVQPERGPVAWEQFHEHLVERNFCPRCGKRTADLTTIHTCTPPQGNT